MSRLVQGVVGYFVGVYTGNWTLFASALIGEAQDKSARKKARRQRDAFNGALKDRLEMVDRDPNQPRTLAMGRVRAVEGVRRPWQSGTHLENLTLPVSFAAHEIDAFEQFYLHDTPVTLDGSGWVQTAPWLKTEPVVESQNGTLDGSGGAVVAIAYAPIGTPTATWAVGAGADLVSGDISVLVSGLSVTLSGGQPGAVFSLVYLRAPGISRVRIRPYLGTAAQSVGGDLSAEYPGKLRTTDHYRGIPLVIMDCVYDPDVFPQGRPELTAVFRGAKLYDPRKDSTVPGGSGAHRYATPSTWEWSENPALQVLRYATWEFGMAIPIADISLADIIEAATACDVSSVFTLRKTDGSTSTVTLPRYRCGIVISSDADRRSSMDAICETMAGRWCWAGGIFRVRAGTKRAASFTLGESWLSEAVDSSGQPNGDAVISGANGVPRDQRINRVTGRCVDPAQRYQMLAFPAVQDATLIAAKGVRADEVDFEGVNHIAHAQHLASMAIRKAQAGLRIEAQCGLRALKVELLDVGAFDLPDYGFAGNEAEVVGWSWSPGNTIKLQLEEISAGLFTLDAELKGRDPAPDSNLRKPWEVEQITGLAVTSGTSPTLDGSIITRTTVTWAPVMGETVRRGGDVEVQYAEAVGTLPAGDWPSWPEAGNSTKAVIPSLLAGRYFYFRARAVQRLPLVRGPWSSLVLHKIDNGAQTALEAGVAAAAAAAAAAQASANAANSSLANIASDSLLTPDEKPRVILDREVILAEQAGINAQADDYAVTTEKAAYVAAVSALTTYLATLTAPVLWSDLSGNTTIVGATFRSKFGDVYTTRQALLDKVSANAKARLGALATLNAVDTAQIAANAATEVFEAYDAGPITRSNLG